MLAPMRIAEQRGGEPRGVDESDVRPRRLPRMARLSRSVGSEKSALRVKSPGRISAVLTTIARLARLDRRQHLLVAGDDDVAAEDEIGAAGRDADGVDVVRRAGDADVAVDRAALLREAGHVDDAGSPCLPDARPCRGCAPMVTTPVPPTPVTMMPKGALDARAATGSGSALSTSPRERGRRAPCAASRHAR